MLDLTNLTAARKTDTRAVGFVVRNCLEAQAVIFIQLGVRIKTTDIFCSVHSLLQRVNILSYRTRRADFQNMHHEGNFAKFTANR